MKSKRILCIFCCVAVLMSCLTLFASAADYVEYYEYSGVGISESVAKQLSSYALNFCSSRGYRYWSAVRVGQYQYLIAFYNKDSDFHYGNVAELFEGAYCIYDEHMYSYRDGNNTRYQVGMSNISYSSVTVQITRGYTIGNNSGNYGVSSYTSDMDSVYLRYALYVLIIFMLLYVAFQFMKKRWLIQ